jgi:hypothetical protein
MSDFVSHQPIFVGFTNFDRMVHALALPRLESGWALACCDPYSEFYFNQAQAARSALYPPLKGGVLRRRMIKEKLDITKRDA